MHASTHVNDPHATPGVRHYVSVWAWLIVLTGVTVGVTWLDMKDFVVFTAMLVASVKASLVLLYFMHLRHGPPVHLAVFGLALVIFGVFLTLTFADVLFLGS